MTEPLREKPNAEKMPRTASAGVIVNGHYAPPPKDADGKLWVRTTALIQADPQELYSLWHNVEAAPLWQEQVASVVSTGERTSHWVMESGSSTVEWDAEILAENRAAASHGGRSAVTPTMPARSSLRRLPADAARL